MSSDFIESNYPDFWNAYKTAEEVVKSFPNVCIQQIRIIAENITKEVMRLANMEGIEDDQWRRLEYLKDCQIIDNEIFGLLTEIRKLGNDAAHELAQMEQSKAEKLLGNIREIFGWFEETVTAGITPQPNNQNSRGNASANNTIIQMNVLYQRLNNEIYGHIKSPDYNLISKINLEYLPDMPKESNYARSALIANKFEIVMSAPKLLSCHLIEQADGQASLNEYQPLYLREYNQHTEDLAPKALDDSLGSGYAGSGVYPNGQPAKVKTTLNLYPEEYSREAGYGKRYGDIPLVDSVSGAGGPAKQLPHEASTLYNFYTSATGFDFLEKQKADGNDIPFNVDNLPLTISMYDTAKYNVPIN